MKCINQNTTDTSYRIRRRKVVKMIANQFTCSCHVPKGYYSILQSEKSEFLYLSLGEQRNKDRE